MTIEAIAFQDSDDIWRADKLEKRLLLMAKETGIPELVSGMLQMML